MPPPDPDSGRPPEPPEPLHLAIAARVRPYLASARRGLFAGARQTGRFGRRFAGSLWRRRNHVVLALLVLALTPPAVLATWGWLTVARLDLGRIQDASFIYSAGQLLSAGLAVEAIDLGGTLRRLRYQEVTEPPGQAGQYRRAAGAWDIFLRERDDPRAQRAALRIRLSLENGRIGAVQSVADGARLDGIELEPELLSGLSDTAGQFRRPVRLAQVPKHVIAAVVAAEDHRFFEHGGVDAKAVIRALWINFRKGEVAQGGSTLTQQLVKNLVLTPKRTWDRKIREATVAVMLEWRYRKPEILEAYLNAVYLGQHGNAGVYGVGAAARSYFGKDVEGLTLAEAALLAGMIRAPNSYSPVQNPDRAEERRDAILARMRDLGMIDEGARARASQEPIQVRTAPGSRLLGPYFLDYVRTQIEQPQDDNGWAGGGLRIYSTLDPVLQRAAEGAITRGLDRLEGRYKQLRRTGSGHRLQAVLIALDPASGEVRAMVGGRDYALSQFNRATHARRQPGSAFKPFVYLAALRFGPDGGRPRLTPASLVEDAPFTLQVGRDAWSPRNYEDRFEGTVSVRRALEQSLNAATVRVAEAVGLDAVIRTAQEAGFTSPMQPVPALVLGSFEVTPLELVSAYATFANGGERVSPTPVRVVVDREGTIAAEPAPGRVPAVRPDEAYLVTYLLRGVMERGTGASARGLGVDGPVAGKTGTTNDGRDAWFVGFTPRLVTLVWVGFDEQDVIRLSGSQAALPIWADFMKTAMSIVPGGAFMVPTSVVFRDVDPSNGKLATRYCPVVFREAFLATTEPTEVCSDHGGSFQYFEGLFRKLLDAFGKPRSDSR